MKKLFMFLAVAGLATFGASCSSDDGGGSGGGQPALVAKASPSSVKINENVTFSATADGKAVDGVKFYSAGKELQNPHKFAAKGEYNVIAKKTGYLESAAITVTVTEEGVITEPKQLTLTVMPAEVTLGQAVSFIVYEGTTDVTSTAKIFVNGTLSESSYTATAVGTYTVKATKEGATDSVEKTFKVNEAPVVPEDNFLQVGDQVVGLEGASFHYYTQGEFVYSEVLPDGRLVVPVMMRMFTRDITSTIEVEDYDNSSALLLYVVQDTTSSTVNWPWAVPAADVLIVDYSGWMDGVEWAADSETGFASPVFTAPGNDGRGTLVFAAEGNTEEGDVLASVYDNAFQGFFSSEIPAGRGVLKSFNSKKAVKTNSLQSLKRK